MTSRLLGLLLASVVLTACTGGGDGAVEGQSPEEVLATAATTLDETSGVDLTLATDNLPTGVSGITNAKGVVTDAPAFEGTINVIYGGLNAEVPVVALDGVVYAEIPFTQTGFQEIDPAEYGAPDPAALKEGETGFSTLLGVTEDVEEGSSQRGGADNSEVLTTYSGTVPGEAMKKVIPSSAGENFEVRYLVTDDGELRQAVLTGVFYADSAEMTYTVDFANYGTTKEIVAP